MHSARPIEPAPVVAPTTTRGAIVCALLLLVLPLTLLPVFTARPVDAWWPSNGLVAALLLLVQARHRPVAAAVATVALGATVAAAYDAPPPVALVAALTVTLPAYGAVLLLGRSWGRTTSVTDDRAIGFAGTRYHLVLLASSAAAGALVLVFIGVRSGLLAGVYAGLVSVVGAAAALLVVLPVVAPVSGRPRTGSAPELWGQRLALLATVPASLLVGPALVLAFPLLSWAGLRAGRREAHVQTFLFSTAVYAVTVAGWGPLNAARQAEALPEGLAILPVYLYIAALAYLVVPLARAVERLSQSRLDAQRTARTLQHTIDAAHHTVFIVSDPDGRITHFNQGASAVSGYSAAEMVGRLPSVLVDDDEVARQAEQMGVEADFFAVCRAQVERDSDLEWRWRCRDGSVRTVSLGISEITDAEGVSGGFLSCGYDVTEQLDGRRALEAALHREHQSVLRLQEVDHVKQELVSNVSHELRTPITSIAGYAELLADSSLGELTRPQRDALQRIERNALRLQTLVDDLLTLSRSESGRLQLSRSALDLGELARGAWELFEEQLRHRDLDARLTLLPQPVVVVGDRDALERVVVNLVSNAVKFTPDGGSVELTVTRGESGRVLLVVRDTGIGIPPEEQEQLFTRFFRSSRATDAAIQGTGLGLSIVQALVSQHGGQVSVRSRTGQGTRVTVELPGT